MKLITFLMPSVQLVPSGGYKIVYEYANRLAKDGYRVLSCGYTHKEKKSKGEVIDSCEIVKCVMEYSTVWEGLE